MLKGTLQKFITFENTFTVRVSFSWHFHYTQFSPDNKDNHDTMRGKLCNRKICVSVYINWREPVVLIAASTPTFTLFKRAAQLWLKS